MKRCKLCHKPIEEPGAFNDPDYHCSCRQCEECDGVGAVPNPEEDPDELSTFTCKNCDGLGKVMTQPIGFRVEVRHVRDHQDRDRLASEADRWSLGSIDPGKWIPAPERVPRYKESLMPETTEPRTLGWAMKQAHNGARIQRDSWKAQDKWVCYMPPMELAEGMVNSRTRKFLPTGPLKVAGYLVVYNEEPGLWTCGWSPTQGDMTATDWSVLE